MSEHLHSRHLRLAEPPAPERPPLSPVGVLSRRAMDLASTRAFSRDVKQWVENGKRVSQRSTEPIDVPELGRYTFSVTAFLPSAGVNESVANHPAGVGTTFLDLAREKTASHDGVRYRLSLRQPSITLQIGVDTFPLTGAEDEPQTVELEHLLSVMERTLTPDTTE